MATVDAFKFGKARICPPRLWVIASGIYSNAPILIHRIYLLGRTATTQDPLLSESLSGIGKSGCEDKPKNSVEAVKGGLPHPPRDPREGPQEIGNTTSVLLLVTQVKFPDAKGVTRVGRLAVIGLPGFLGGYPRSVEAAQRQSFRLEHHAECSAGLSRSPLHCCCFIPQLHPSSHTRRCW